MMAGKASISVSNSCCYNITHAIHVGVAVVASTILEERELLACIFTPFVATGGSPHAAQRGKTHLHGGSNTPPGLHQATNVSQQLVAPSIQQH